MYFSLNILKLRQPVRPFGPKLLFGPSHPSVGDAPLIKDINNLLIFYLVQMYVLLLHGPALTR